MLPPGWSMERHTHNQKTGEPLAGRGFTTYHSPGGSPYRTIASSWETFRSRELSPHINDHGVLILMGQDPDRCVLQSFVGSVALQQTPALSTAAERAQSARQMASQQLEDLHLRHGEQVTDACDLPAVVSVDSEGSRTSESACDGGTSVAAVSAPVRPVLRQRSASGRITRNPAPWFYARRYGTGVLRKPRWRTRTAVPAPTVTLVPPHTVPLGTPLRHSPRLASPSVRQSGMLVLAGVQLNYRHLPTVCPTPGASHALVRHVSPLRLKH